ncbi:MAG: DUF4390 domain-containing protein [Deltaproteobacteria bacterium]|jgi:hypothetical protein|nr:DUF4390 domain-containing protein [Deltaproteobacteria bacterium]
MIRPRPERARSLLVAALVCGLALAPLVALAGLPSRKLGIWIHGDELRASFSFRDVFSSEVQDKLDSGLPTKVMLQINVERHGEPDPVAYWARSTDIVYDLLEERYLVTVEDRRGRRRARASTMQEAMNLAAVLWHEPVADLEGMPAGRYRLHVLAEVNPVSKAMVRNIRRWLARPRAVQRDAEVQGNFFGSFVGIFVDRRIGQADRQVAFVSQWFEVGER